MTKSADATALSKLIFNTRKALPDGAFLTDSEEPIMWLLQDQGNLFFVNNSAFSLSSVAVFFAHVRDNGLYGRHLEAISAAKAGFVGPYEVCRLCLLEDHISRSLHWPWMEIEISVQWTQRTMRLLSCAVETSLPNLPLLYKAFNLPEHVRYVYEPSEARL